MMQPAMPSIGWLKHAFGRQRRLSLNPLHPSVKVSTAFLGHGGRLKRPFFCLCSYNHDVEESEFCPCGPLVRRFVLQLVKILALFLCSLTDGSCPVVLHEIGRAHV